MPWKSSSRRDGLRAEGHSGWAEQKLARQVIARDRGVCYVCGRPGADQADHVIPRSRGGAHAAHNLRAIHAVPCHREKTKAETKAAQRAPRRRPPEGHPGMVA